jgi:hypothetical protein
MPKGRTGPLAALAALVALGTLVGGAAGAQDATAPLAASPAAEAPPSLPQSSYDVIRVQQDGTVLPYVVWVDWVPTLVTTPDGGAWAFFTAQVRTADGLGSRRLYATRFDPDAGVWLPAAPLPGGQIQYGPAAAVDAAGIVHLVFSDRASDVPDALSTLLYTRTTADGGWETPVPVAPHPNAGHQMMPALVAGANGSLHLLWRDQRYVSPELRAALVANADLLASDFVDGAWTEPVQVNRRPSPDLNAGWPVVVADGDRLVAVWSTYRGTTVEEMRTAARVEWSTRPLDDPNGWSEPATVLDRAEGDTGGRSLDLAADPRGGVALVYGRLRQQENDLFLRRLERGASEWGEEARLGSGDLGYLPSLAVAADGTALVAFNSGRNRDVEVGALVVPPNGAPPSAPRILTPGEEGEHGRVALALDAAGRPWIVYAHAETGSANATEIRALRGARMTD